MKNQKADWWQLLDAQQTRIEVKVNGYSRVRERWRFRDRVIAEQLIFLVDQHEITFGACGQQWRMGPGSFVWVRPGFPYSVEGHSHSRPVRLFHLRIRVWHGRNELLPPFDMRRLDQTEKIGDVVRLLRESLNDRRPHSMAVSRELLRLLTLLVEDEAALQREGEQGWWTLERKRRLESYVTQNLHRGIDGNAMADLFELSPDYFTRIFRREYGNPPRVWLVNERLRQAADWLVESNESVSEIADRFGFTDLFQFSRQFKKRHGISPSEFRRRRGCLVIEGRED